MKSILLSILLLFTFLIIPPFTINAEEYIEEDTEIIILEELQEDEEITTEEKTSVTQMPIIVPKPELSFFGILFAVLTPAIFIIIAYLLVKHFRL
jgi:hypothetical protein